MNLCFILYLDVPWLYYNDETHGAYKIIRNQSLDSSQTLVVIFHRPSGRLVFFGLGYIPMVRFQARVYGGTVELRDGQ